MRCRKKALVLGDSSTGPLKVPCNNITISIKQLAQFALLGERERGKESQIMLKSIAIQRAAFDFKLKLQADVFTLTLK